MMLIGDEYRYHPSRAGPRFVVGGVGVAQRSLDSKTIEEGKGNFIRVVVYMVSVQRQV